MSSHSTSIRFLLVVAVCTASVCYLQDSSGGSSDASNGTQIVRVGAKEETRGLSSLQRRCGGNQAMLHARFQRAVDQGGSSHLTLKAVAWRSRITSGEPVVLDLTLSNRNSRAVETHAMFELEHGYTEVMVKEPEGEVRLIYPFVIMDIANPIRLSLSPGKTVSAALTVLRGRIWDGEQLVDGSAFQKPGHYEVVVVYAKSCMSTPVSIEVVDARSGKEQEAKSLLLGAETQRLMQGKTDGSDFPVALDELLSQASNTPYLPHVLYGTVTRSLAEQQYAACVQYADEFLKSFPASPLSLRVRLTRATALACSAEMEAGLLELDILSREHAQHVAGIEAAVRQKSFKMTQPQ